MKNYIPLILLAVLAIVYLIYNQQFFKKIETPSFIQELSINSKHLDREVKIWVYLPPDYLEATEPLPVLYMHDGQNLFDEKISFAGEWHVDEALDSLYNEKQFQLVVVGIENGGLKRIDELTPYPNAKYGGGNADNYLNFIEEELFPIIETKFNVARDRKNRGMMGSSLGGLITFYSAFERNEAFSRFGVYSPSFWFNKNIFQLPKQKQLAEDTHMLMMIGEKEENEHHKVIKMKALLDSTQSINVPTSIIPHGEHNEKFWSQHFKDDVYALFTEKN